MEVKILYLMCTFCTFETKRFANTRFGLYVKPAWNGIIDNPSRSISKLNLLFINCIEASKMLEISPKVRKIRKHYKSFWSIMSEKRLIGRQVSRYFFTCYDISFDALPMCQGCRIAAYIYHISADQDWVRHSQHPVLPAYRNMWIYNI